MSSDLTVVEESPQQYLPVITAANITISKTEVNADACFVAQAMKQTNLTTKTYSPLAPVSISSDSIPHVSSSLCNGKPTVDGSRQVPLKSIIAFKAARTGSAFFTSTITRSINSTKYTASQYWEPFAGPVCNSPEMPSEQQENTLRSLLTKKCIRHSKMHKCDPSKGCTSATSPSAVFITSMNPRFLNPNLDWNKVLDRNARVFTLRRTNLVLMAYSVFRHNGCKVDSDFVYDRTAGLPFTLDRLLSCVEHYALGEQELSTSIAYHASFNSDLDPFLVVYEDIMANGPMVQRGIVQYLGLNIPSNNMFEENAITNKQHSKYICDYRDVNCHELTQGLKSDYPCLLKQLNHARDHLAWSVPMLENGTISLHGDCRPLEPLTEKRYTRDVRELYLVPHL